jgi:hypothetical protein
MSERRFALVDFTHMNRAGCLRLSGKQLMAASAVDELGRSPRAGKTLASLSVAIAASIVGIARAPSPATRLAQRDEISSAPARERRS